MHEFSIAQNIIEIAEETIKEKKKTHVTAIELEIGTFSGVDIDALKTALEYITPQSILMNSEIKIITIEGVARCTNCNHRYSPSDIYTPCPRCNNVAPEIISGKDLIVKSITIE